MPGSRVACTAPVRTMLSSPGAKTEVERAMSCSVSRGSLVTRATEGRSITLGWAPLSHAYSVGLQPSFSLEFIADVAAHLVERVRWPSEESLSGREIEVLDLVARGKGNKEIARTLWISEATVKSHLLHVYDKLGAADRASAVAAAMQRGILRL